MDDTKRDELLIELHQDVKWIKLWIQDQKQYKFLVWAALIGAVVSLVVK